MSEAVQAPKFEEHFWGKGNKGFDVLYQNFRVGIGASRELNDFIKEQIAVEDVYVKGLSKVSKNVAAVPITSRGSLSPLWHEIRTMCDSLTVAHSQFIQSLHELSREISDYHMTQKDKMKGNLKGEIDEAGDSLRLLETQDTALQRTKKLYTQSVEQYVKQQKKMEKVKGDANLKNRQQVEGRLRSAEEWMETMKTDYKMAVESHTKQYMGFQGNMHEACQKFGSLEEEHLAHMITFLMKMCEAQETVHIQIGKANQNLHSQLETHSVEKLLCGFVESKGTGKDKPSPEKFRPITERALASLVAATTAHDDYQRSKAPSTTAAQPKSVKPEKSIRQKMRFKKKTKVGVDSSTGEASNTSDHVISDPQESIPVGEVDDEGYSIRPQDAAVIRGFPDDDNPDQDSDDSDFEDDFQSRVRQVQIKDPPQDGPKATVDDIRASVQSLRLGSHSPSTRIKKATSSQSLNNIIQTPPQERKTIDAFSTSSMDPVMSSLLDSDVSLSPGVGMVPVLQPLPPAVFSIDPMEPLRPLAWSQDNKSQPLLPSPIATPPSSSAPTAPVPSSPPSSSSSSSSLTPSTPTERPIPKPRQGSGKSSQDGGVVSSTPETPSTINLFATGSWGNSSDDETSPAPAPHTKFSISESPLVRSDTSSSSSSVDSQLTPVGIGGGAVGGAVGGASSILSPPLPPNPRKNTRQRGATPEPTSSSSIITPLATTSLSSTPVSPNVPPPPQPSTQTVASQGTRNSSLTGTPLAVAFQESCNAIFKSTDPSDCMVKVTGEMVVSFPAALVGQVENHSPLTFTLHDTTKLKQVLHNQILLTREGDSYRYRFNQQALGSHLATMSSRKSAPYYNMQLIKYEVDISDGSLLPLRLTAYWKCTESVTNFRFDYRYISSNLPPLPASRPPPPLSQMSVAVPVDGGVRNTLSKPSGNWLPEKQQIVWKIGDVSPGTNDTVTQIHAKFDVTQGPSHPQPAEVKFVCDGCTLSGVDLELTASDYRISLLKRKFSSGMYTAEMRY